VIGIEEHVSRAVGQLLGRSSGPLHFRLIFQPILATFLAVRAGMRDARRGDPPFLWTLLTQKSERRRLFRSGWKDIGKVFIMALVLDTIYQLIVIRGFYLLQTLIVAVAVALVPYIVFRGLTTRASRRAERK
jgi:hypothetical protein